jgi:hypothetical protein
MRTEITTSFPKSLVASVKLCDGRVIRVCGNEDDSDKILIEIEKTFRWEVRQQVMAELGRMFE